MKNKKKMLGICCLILAALILIFSLISVLGGEKDDSKAGSNLDAVDELQGNEVATGTDSSDIKKEDALDKMNIKYEIPDQIEKRIPDVDTLKEKIEEFLVEEDFYEDVTRVISSYVITEDFNKNLIMLTFTLNDKARTTLSCTIYKDDSKYEFNYY